jgi:hypothetical protein
MYLPFVMYNVAIRSRLRVPTPYAISLSPPLLEYIWGLATTGHKVPLATEFDKSRLGPREGAWTKLNGSASFYARLCDSSINTGLTVDTLSRCRSLYSLLQYCSCCCCCSSTPLAESMALMAPCCTYSLPTSGLSCVHAGHQFRTAGTRPPQLPEENLKPLC